MSKNIESLINRQDEIDLERKDIKKQVLARINEVRKIIAESTGKFSDKKTISWSELRDIGDNEIIHVSLGSGPFSDSFPRKFLSMTDAAIKTAVKK